MPVANGRLFLRRRLANSVYLEQKYTRSIKPMAFRTGCSTSGCCLTGTAPWARCPGWTAPSPSAADAAADADELAAFLAAVGCRSYEGGAGALRTGERRDSRRLRSSRILRWGGHSAPADARPAAAAPCADGRSPGDCRARRGPGSRLCAALRGRPGVRRAHRLCRVAHRGFPQAAARSGGYLHTKSR